VPACFTVRPGRLRSKADGEQQDPETFNYQLTNNFDMKKNFNRLLLFLLLFTGSQFVFAQTDIDAIMMGKGRLCIGPMYSHSSWKNYWEGERKRTNLNLGNVSTEVFGLMGNYGITSKLNVLFSVPYVKTKASAGTLHGMKGFQDLSLFVKWMPVEKDFLHGIISVYGIAGGSVPLTNYVVDYLPLAIGLQSKTALARIMADYQLGSLFVTASATYTFRDNIKLDRNAYYTNESIASDEVRMPNAYAYNVRAGFRNERLIAEGVMNIFKTNGGFDITRNNMPFPSNRMNGTTVGGNFKYVVLPSRPEISIVAGANFTVSGRNIGQTNTFYGSFFYVLDFSHNKKQPGHSAKTD
jgi:hypothetical protein